MCKLPAILMFSQSLLSCDGIPEVSNLTDTNTKDFDKRTICGRRVCLFAYASRTLLSSWSGIWNLAFGTAGMM